jgi:hypothetical protein
MTDLTETERTSFGVSMRKKILIRLDQSRGDIPRSKVIDRVMEKHLSTLEDP